MEKVQFEILFSQNLSQVLADEFKLLLIDLGCSTEASLSNLAVDSMDQNEIVFVNPLEDHKHGEYTVSWQSYLANLARHNIYNHS